MIAKVKTAAYRGIQAYPVEIEVDVAYGLPQFIVVGLPDLSVKESRERVRSAIKNSGYRFPPEKITINLAPADVKKEGSAFDLAIALGILAASDVISPERLAPYLFLGELALDGSLRPFQGAIVIASGLRNQTFVMPEENAKEASLEKDAIIYAVRDLKEVIQFLRQEKNLEPLACWSPAEPASEAPEGADFSEVKGQAFAKRAIEIAVAGGHNLLLIGPPGSGKTMLARRIPTLMPPLGFEEALEIAKIYSVAGLITKSKNWVTERPFRAPHPLTSPVALVGGGSWPKPGEISLAHGGVLFLDEFPEFRHDVLEALRSPLEEGVITVSRAKSRASYPARFLLVAAMNPCPCGYLSDPARACRCSLGQIQKYQAKISGPILDRIDLHVEVPPLTYQTLASEELAESSETIRARILQCRKIQAERYEEKIFKVNAMMRAREIRQYAKPETEGRKLMERAMKELHLSARAYYKILKIARTIADLTPAETISSEHIAEAIQYRFLDRQWWA